MKEILTGAAALLHANNNLGLHLVTCVAIVLLWRVWMWWAGDESDFHRYRDK